MRYSCARSLSGFLGLMLVASSASAVTMDWTPIGNPGNRAESLFANCGQFPYQPCGAVPYSYSIGTYEVTNAQYAEFLNAKGAADTLGLYSVDMGSGSGLGGITRSGSSGSYTYDTIAGRENKPVNYVSFYDALRFANWMSNGKGGGDTETGSYTLLGGSPAPSNGATVSRNPGATIVLPTENEWYKAAYYIGDTAGYFTYPTYSSALPICAMPTAAPNRANCGGAVPGLVTDVGSYTGSASPYGTFDQGGNVFEWNETVKDSGGNRGIRGGSFSYTPDSLSAFSGGSDAASMELANGQVGFRLAMVPEPGTGLLVIAGLLGLTGWRRGRT
jgi:formylglycine-generating enzyme required for sulfatase activity